MPDTTNPDGLPASWDDWPRETRTVRLRISTYGKAPAKYGKNALKVGIADKPLLVRAGWQHVGSGRNYQFVSPPDGSSEKKPIVSVEIPTDEEILRLGSEIHAMGETFRGANGPWIIIYRPAGTEVVRLVRSVEYTSENWGRTTEHDTPITTKRAELEIGTLASWGVHLTWEGDSQTPIWSRNDKNVIA